PDWQRFDPPAEGRTDLQKIYRLLHRPIDVTDGALTFSLTAGEDTVRVLGFSLFPDPAASSKADRHLLKRIQTAGTYSSEAPLNPILADLQSRVAADPTDAFAASSLDPPQRLRLAGQYRQQMGCESVTEQTGLGPFDPHPAT